MVPRHPLARKPAPGLPDVWLFSDERAAAGIVELAAILPPGSGIVFRHDRLAPGARWRMFRRLARIARTRKLLLLLAGHPAHAKRWNADGVHLRPPLASRARAAHRLGLIVAMPVHGEREARAARRAGVDATFVSPLHPTRSHPGAPALGRSAWLRLARLAGAKAIALGGMTPARVRALRRAGARNAGWAAIDSWDEKAVRQRQKRKAVPT
jgi:thiamine-phosphate pyrophosphorylase